MTRAGGFSFVELLVALTIALVVSGSALVLMVPSQGLAASRAETADMQQRLRVAADTLYQRLVAAGAGAYGGATAGPLSDNVAPILPYRAVGASPDPPGTFRSDAVTILSVPRNGAQPIGATYWLKTDDPTATYQLMAADASGIDVPVVDHVVALAFEYYGDPQPPMMRKPLADPVGPWTTYGPKPASTPMAPFASGENCVFVDDPSPTPQPRLPVLGSGSVALTSALLTDGPWCPNDGAVDRWDADLLRVRSIAVRLRVQAALSTLRGPASALFAHGGSSRGGHPWVPDQEIRFQVSPRNLNLVR